MKRKLAAGEVAAIGFLLLLLWYSFALQIEQPSLYEGYTVIALGDSITAGYGLRPDEEPYVDILARQLKVTIINEGESGDTTASALRRLERDILSKNPDIVIVFLGGNDYLWQIPPEISFANLRQIVDILQDNGIRVLLVGIDKSFLSTYEREFEKIVYEKNVAGYVPDVLGGIALRPDLLFDNIHPNERGHEIVAQRILPELERILQSLL